MSEPVIDEIIEQELETMEHLEKVVGRLDVSAKALKMLARKVYVLAKRKRLTNREAKKLFVKGFVKLAIQEWAHDVPKVKDLTDKHLEAQFEAVQKLDKPLSSLRPIRDVDIKARMTAKAEQK